MDKNWYNGAGSEKPILFKSTTTSSKSCAETEYTACKTKQYIGSQSYNKLMLKLKIFFQNVGRFAYGSFPLPSVRLRLWSICLRLIWQFAYVLSAFAYYDNR